VSEKPEGWELDGATKALHRDITKHQEQEAGKSSCLVLLTCIIVLLTILLTVKAFAPGP
jgi:hypothetical protein